MELRESNWRIQIWLTKDETAKWASNWPCSTISGKRLFAEFEENGLIDLKVDGKYSFDISADELNAISSDFISKEIDDDHPLYHITVGQFN